MPSTPAPFFGLTPSRSVPDDNAELPRRFSSPPEQRRRPLALSDLDSAAQVRSNNFLTLPCTRQKNCTAPVQLRQPVGVTGFLTLPDRLIHHVDRRFDPSGKTQQRCVHGEDGRLPGFGKDGVALPRFRQFCRSKERRPGKTRVIEVQGSSPMRFARVEDARLPRAHGITDKVDDDAPPLADLRSIISRMRAVNGPDISSFQQSYLAAQTTQPPVHEENGLRGNPEIERFDRIRAQILSGDADRASDRSATAVKQQAGFGPPSSLREGSLRDSLLKRPLGSLIRK